MKRENNIGPRIQRAREYRKIDRNELANAIGSAYREILRWETTTQEPRAIKLKQIADALKIKIEYFLQDLPFEEESSETIIYYLPEEEFYQKTGFSNIFNQNKKISKEYLDSITNVQGLTIALKIMTGLINSSDLPIVYTLISKDILDKSDNDSNEKITPESIRQELKNTIDGVKDPVTLRTIGKILITYTRDEDTKEERALLLQLSSDKQ